MTFERATGPVIGIIGGIGPQASARLHRVVVDLATEAWRGSPELEFPEILHYSVRARHDFSRPGPARNETVDRISRAAESLRDAGVTRIGLACNTAHLLFPEVEARTGVELLRIPPLVAAEAGRREARRVGLLATATTIETDLYADVRAVAELVAPPPEVTRAVEEHIGAVYSGFHGEAERAEFVRLVRRFAGEAQLDQVILGCTELPVAFGEHDRTGVIDSTDELARRLVEDAFAEHR